MNKKNLKLASLPVALMTAFMFCFQVMCHAQTRPLQKRPEPLPEMSAKVYDKISPVTVKIIYDKGKKNGSGVIVGLTEKGRALILTACHVVAMNFEETDPDIALEFYKDIVIKTNTEVRLLRASVLPNYVDRTNDLALLATNVPVSVDNAIRYNRTDKVNPGETVAAFGYPSSDKLSQTVGRITRLESRYLVFDAKIAPGSSGGPLIDKHGRLIGVSTLIEGAKDGYAINMNLVLSVVENWLKGIKLKEKWEYQKYGTGFEKTVKSWPFLAGTGTILAGVGAYAYVQSNKNPSPEEEFVKPLGRPDGN